MAVSQAFIFHFKCYSILHFAVSRLLRWAILFYFRCSRVYSHFYFTICPRFFPSSWCSFVLFLQTGGKQVSGSESCFVLFLQTGGNRKVVLSLVLFCFKNVNSSYIFFICVNLLMFVCYGLNCVSYHSPGKQ